MTINRNSTSKQLLKAAACFLLLLSTCVVPVYADESGSCGKDVDWNFSNGVLTINGSGPMDNYRDGNPAPWNDIKSDIESVVISDGVTSIGNLAFYDCVNLTQVTLSKTVKQIGDYSFLDCENLQSVNTPDLIKKIGRAAFKMCKSLISFDFIDGINSIGSEAFFGCKSLTSIYLPSSLIQIGESVFAYCDNLKSATIDANINQLPEWTFYGCENLQNVSLSKEIQSVGDLSFYDCVQLTKVFTADSTDTAETLTNQIKDDVPSFSSVQSTKRKADDEPTFDSDSNDSNMIIDSIQDGSSSFQGAMNTDGDSYQVVIDSTIAADDMWQTIIEKSDTYINLNEKTEVPLEVNVSLGKDLKVDGKVLEEFAGKNVDLNIETNNLQLKINCSNLSKDYTYLDLNLNYQLDKIRKYDDSMRIVLKESEAFLLKFKGMADYPMTIKIPLGLNYAYGYASLFEKDGQEWKLVHSVRLDSKGNATLFLNGFDSLTEYMIGLNLDGVNITNAYIPSELSGDYGILTDENGNMYEVTGIQSKWGITLNQFSLIVFGALGGVIVLVGLVMFIIFKMQQNKEKIRREVMNESKSNK